MAIEAAKTSNGPTSDVLTGNLTDSSKSLREPAVEYDMYTLSRHRKCRPTQQTHPFFILMFYEAAPIDGAALICPNDLTLSLF